MKKFLAVFLCILMVFSVFTVAVSAKAEEDAGEVVVDINEETEKEEYTTRKATNSDGLLVPINFTQLKASVIFKVFEKAIKFVLKMFLSDEEMSALDASLAGDISSVGDEVASAIIEGSQFLDNNS